MRYVELSWVRVRVHVHNAAQWIGKKQQNNNNRRKHKKNGRKWVNTQFALRLLLLASILRRSSQVCYTFVAGSFNTPPASMLHLLCYSTPNAFVLFLFLFLLLLLSILRFVFGATAMLIAITIEAKTTTTTHSINNNLFYVFLYIDEHTRFYQTTLLIL